MMLQSEATFRRPVDTGRSSVVDLRTVIRRKDAEIAELKSALTLAKRDAAGWRRKWLRLTGEECPSFDKILDIVCDEFGADRDDVLSDRRCSAVMTPRHVAMYLCLRKTRRSFFVIGKYFRRDHSTIMQNCRRLAAKMENDAALAARVKALAEKVG